MYIVCCDFLIYAYACKVDKKYSCVLKRFRTVTLFEIKKEYYISFSITHSNEKLCRCQENF